MALGTKYEVAAGSISCLDKTLEAGKYDEVIFGGQPSWLPDFIEVFSESGDPIYFTLNGTEPKVSDAKTHKLPAVVSSRKVPIRAAEAEGSTLVVKLISPSAATYDVSLL